MNDAELIENWKVRGTWVEENRLVARDSKDALIYLPESKKETHTDSYVDTIDLLAKHIKTIPCGYNIMVVTDSPSITDLISRGKLAEWRAYEYPSGVGHIPRLQAAGKRLIDVLAEKRIAEVCVERVSQERLEKTRHDARELMVATAKYAYEIERELAKKTRLISLLGKQMEYEQRIAESTTKS